MRMPPDIYDLDIIDQAYGRDADLYVDVLSVSYLASDAEIQSAFFDRRSEIFTVLAKLNLDGETDDDEIALSQRRFAERRMDAVVMAFRTLKDPHLRGIYEGDREQRITRRNNISTVERHPSQDELSSPRGVSSFDDSLRTAPSDDKTKVQKSRRPKRRVVDPSVTSSVLSKSSKGSTLSRSSKGSATSSRNSPVESPPRVPRHSLPRRKQKQNQKKMKMQKKKLNTSRDSEQTHQETSSDEETMVVATDEKREEAELVTSSDKTDDGVLTQIRESRIVRTISEEIHGAYLDTYSAFDQVFNAFTLQDGDIDAVCGRIEKAKQQLAPGLAPGEVAK